MCEGDKCEFYDKCERAKESLLCTSKLKFACSLYHYKKGGYDIK